MKGPVTRRRFLSVVSAASLAACGKRDTSGHSETRGEFSWSGIGFGIDMSLEIFGVTRAEGESLGSSCERAIQTLERAISLYLENSELSILNRERILSSPTPLFRNLLAHSIDLQRRTLGYYQPAIHGAWLWLEQHDIQTESSEWMRQCAAADLKFLEITPGGPIRLTHPLTQLSMNAIGQGFLADTVAAQLREAGVSSALLHLGESYAIGSHPEGRPWNLAILGTPVNGEVDLVGTVEFSDAGLAVSSQDSTRILIDPVANTVHRHARVAAIVSREGAAVADAFATAFAVAPPEAWPHLAAELDQAAGAQIHLWQDNQPVFSQP